jgi:putative restriction endonuclease
VRISRERSSNASLRELNQRQGRGEYEWAGLQPDDPNREDLVNRRILLRMADAVLLDTACEFEHAQGKWRTRIASDARSERFMYPIYHAAVALMMPCPTRTYANVGAGLPVLRTDEYFIEDIISGHVRFTNTNAAEFVVRTVGIANQSVPGEDIDTAERFTSVRRIWADRARLPEEIATLIQQHEALVAAGNQVSIQGRGLVRRIQTVTAETSRDLDVDWTTPRTDPVPTLLEMLGLGRHDRPPIPIEEIAPEYTEIRRRELARQRRSAAAQGPQSARFRRRVRDAYGSACIICGLRLPRFWDDGKAGVDAVHLLPESEFGVDQLSNGVCLCKLHRWAFDEGLVEIVHDAATGYAFAIPQEAETRAASESCDLSFLRTHAEPIPFARLPDSPQAQPNPVCLRRLRELLHP